jgi:hypothetical protein
LSVEPFSIMKPLGVYECAATRAVVLWSRFERVVVRYVI